MLKLYLLLLGSVFGVAAQLQLKQLCSMTAVAVCLLLIALLWLSGAVLIRLNLANTAIIVKILRSQLYNSLLYLSIGAMLGFAWTNYRATLVMAQLLAPNLENKALLVDGFIVGLPRKNSNGWQFRFKVNQAYQLQNFNRHNKTAAVATGLRLQQVKLPAIISLSWYSGYQPFVPPTLRQQHQPKQTRASELPQLLVGQQWLLPVQLKRPHANFNPGGFDYELYAWRNALLALGSVKTTAVAFASQFNSELAALATNQLTELAAASLSKQAVLLNERRWLAPIDRLRQTITQRIEQQIGTDARVAGMLAALTVGAQAGFSQEDWQVFRATGVIHLVSISGLHITMFAFMAIWLIRRCWRQLPWLCEQIPAQKVGLILGAALALAYALLSGFAVPAQRTSLMLLLLVSLQLSARRWPISLVLLLVMVLVLAFDPWAFLQPGFWLSFVATALLFTFNLAPSYANSSLNILTGKSAAERLSPLAKLTHKLYQLLRQQWLISLALLPLTILFFQTISWVSVIANLLAIPLVSWLITPLALLGLIWPIFWQINLWLINALYYWLDWLASFPLALSLVAHAPWYINSLAILGAALAILPIYQAWRWLGAVAISLLFIWPSSRPQQGEFELLFFDVGQGSAVAVLTKQHLLLYDAGPAYAAVTAAERVLIPFFAYIGILPDYLLISRQNLNNLAGAYQLLQQRPQLHWMGAVALKHPLQQLRPADKRCQAGDKWHWDGVDFEILYPRDEDYAPKHRYGNKPSCVLRISNQQEAILLPGNLVAQQERELIKRYSDSTDKLSVRGFLVPNHASATSSSVALLQALQADWAIAQVGYLNRFKQPQPQIVRRYAKHSIAFYNSIDCGMLTWRSSQPKQLSCWRQEKGKYWNLLSKNLR